ncbi:Tubulin-folding cofactor B [Trichinella pseudospiralis]|uniref:Tubulin-folding cofactor B n=1 Tax=Trichinella pseudospiralis TaxID=6337 RepID=A0A0V1E840_TRIPS|nr:Tubulin-folding cofactor B [Trichinella pseudospiralis]KRZ29666.1 Tubulin-folding cofactor B [Trichinella pseudospiralis]KRZ36818.1 Tubulin-folding cofactor B [Trichinella pseudospiralis]
MESSKEFIDLVVTSDVQTFYSRRRFPLKITVGELKKKVEILTGIPFSCMTLQIVKPDGQKLKLFDANETLADLNISDGTTIHVNIKICTVRDFLLQNKLGKYNPNHEKLVAKEEMEIDVLDKQVGQRCIVKIGDPQEWKRGKIAYIGETDFKPGLWIGVEYDEEVGKHDGSVNGKRYFQCMDKRGAFVKPHLVKTEMENEEALEL